MPSATLTTKKKFKDEKSIEILNILVLIKNRSAKVSCTSSFIFDNDTLLEYTYLFSSNKYGREKKAKSKL